MNVKEFKGTLFNVEDKGKWVKARISEAKKEQDGTYSYMSWNCMFLGNSADVVRHCEDKTKIKITSGLVENTYDKETQKGYTTVKVFECEKAEATQQAPVETEDDEDISDLPF